MGTNYYLHTDKPHCETCTCHGPLHIGKSSAGWCFSLHVIPERGLNNLDDWSSAWSADGSVIKNEYGEEITREQMMMFITERSFPRHDGPPYGYSSEAQFHEQNHSQLGPNGLVRHAIGSHCIGHGEGTWDLIPGEFS